MYTNAFFFYIVYMHISKHTCKHVHPFTFFSSHILKHFLLFPTRLAGTSTSHLPHSVLSVGWSVIKLRYPRWRVWTECGYIHICIFFIFSLFTHTSFLHAFPAAIPLMGGGEVLERTYFVRLTGVHLPVPLFPFCSVDIHNIIHV